jgi:hypothetical protein
MDIYRLTPLGESIAHNIRPPRNNARWRVIYYLNRNGAKEKNDIIENTGATSYTLAYLKGKRIISGGEGVAI